MHLPSSCLKFELIFRITMRTKLLLFIQLLIIVTIMACDRESAADLITPYPSPQFNSSGPTVRTTDTVVPVDPDFRIDDLSFDFQLIKEEGCRGIPQGYHSIVNGKQWVPGIKFDKNLPHSLCPNLQNCRYMIETHEEALQQLADLRCSRLVSHFFCCSAGGPIRLTLVVNPRYPCK